MADKWMRSHTGRSQSTASKEEARQQQAGSTSKAVTDGYGNAARLQDLPAPNEIPSTSRLDGLALFEPGPEEDTGQGGKGEFVPKSHALAGLGSMGTRSHVAVVYFLNASTAIEPSANDALWEVVEAYAPFLNVDEPSIFEIHGYADDRGDAEFNGDLSLRRAQSVASFIEAGLGDNPGFVVPATGFGELALGDSPTPEQRGQARRVDVYVSAFPPEGTDQDSFDNLILRKQELTAEILEVAERAHSLCQSAIQEGSNKYEPDEVTKRWKDMMWYIDLFNAFSSTPGPGERAVDLHVQGFARRGIEDMADEKLAELDQLNAEYKALAEQLEAHPSRPAPE